ncbi:ChrR family anti-sigma-E factor [Vibrio hippocampi]|uniref:Anti-sigma-E factor ChrR n=1 Tax=Vibrio hippocampi TaxID=654686 RepID=A0ABN8DJ03_9VIBR|nr:ChrR family anti-sigma-E factor [Vibrio hippocampi]CAH0526726.1 Anti-sigma-E factor ChrR [Vibrio hippocampi]
MARHPEDTLLEAYASGEIDSAYGVAVATHIQHCRQCAEKVALLEEQLASQLSQPQVELSSEQDAELVLENMLQDIMSLDVDYSSPRKRMPVKLSVNGKQFDVPSSLAPLVGRMGEWKSYGGKVFTSAIDIDETHRVSFLYITPGVKVPQHTHKGDESTLVLHGSFSDESGEYGVGDFVHENGETEHSPCTSEQQDCLCLSILTQPMVFTQGVARVFNMFGKGMYP